MQIYKGRSDKAIVDWQWREPSLRNITHLILRNIPDSGGRALDVGCGTGRVSFALAARGYEVEGVDIEERAIGLAKEMAEANGARCTFRTADFGSAGGASGGNFDVVVCSEVLEHVDDYRPIVDNIYDSMRPGGRLVVTVPFDPRKFSVLDEYAGHLRRFTIAEMEAALARFRLRRIVITGFPVYRLFTRAYLAKIALLHQEHSNEALWSQRSTRAVATVLYPLLRIDNALAFTRLGDSMIAVADR